MNKWKFATLTCYEAPGTLLVLLTFHFHLALVILQTIQVVAVASIAATLCSSLCVHLLYLALVYYFLVVIPYCIYMQMHILKIFQNES